MPLGCALSGCCPSRRLPDPCLAHMVAASIIQSTQYCHVFAGVPGLHYSTNRRVEYPAGTGTKARTHEDSCPRHSSLFPPPLPILLAAGCALPSQGCRWLRFSTWWHASFAATSAPRQRICRKTGQTVFLFFSFYEYSASVSNSQSQTVTRVTGPGWQVQRQMRAISQNQ